MSTKSHKKDILHFKISSGLKDLLGQDLITDEFIAVFELVKNSYDANSKEVFVVFENLNSGLPSIKIIDKGKGMDYDDLTNKWIFVGYSAKKDGTEDEENDLLSKVSIKKHYAGAKGVGRFSCDRLGSKLNLFSIKKGKKTIEHIEVDWNHFEKDSKKLFRKIPIKRKSLQKLPPEYDKYKLPHGTILEISNLRDNWDRNKILQLKSSLAKLILPKFNETLKNNFKIIVEAKEESHEDNNYKKQSKKEGVDFDPRFVVNGPVVNFIFETLDIKTTQIYSKISENGEEVTTSIIDRGEFIYEINESNQFDLLENISIQLYFLNRAAKWNFTNKMNIEPVNYGNLFMYKNGFRIHPFGNARDDSYGIDTRKSQGYARRLGTREIIGKIEINGDNPYFKETTSRDGGLIKNGSYNQLIEFIFEVLKRLEKYVVDAKKWGVDDERLKDLKNGNSGEEIVKLLSNLSSERRILNISFNSKIADILKVHEEKSLKRLLKNFKRIADETQDKELNKQINILDKKVKQLRKAKDEAETQVEKIKDDHIAEKKALEKSNKYLLAVSKDLSPEAIALVHHINQRLSQTTPKINKLIKDISKDKIDKKNILTKLTEVKINTEQIEKMSRLVLRSNFNLMVSEEKGDLISYIEEYVQLYNEINELTSINISIDKQIDDYIFLFSKINISIILDNLISNSKRAKADKAQIVLKSGPKRSLKMIFSDNGIGVKEEMKKNLFKIGQTTTAGSGVGLFTNKKLMKNIGGQFNFIGNNIHMKGATFELIF